MARKLWSYSAITRQIVYFTALIIILVLTPSAVQIPIKRFRRRFGQATSPINGIFSPRPMTSAYEAPPGTWWARSQPGNPPRRRSRVAAGAHCCCLRAFSRRVGRCTARALTSNGSALGVSTLLPARPKRKSELIVSVAQGHQFWIGKVAIATQDDVGVRPGLPFLHIEMMRFD